MTPVFARHSTITPTMDYDIHLDVFDLTGALNKLLPVAGVQGAGAGGAPAESA
jgi:hypothetical protein